MSNIKFLQKQVQELKIKYKELEVRINRLKKTKI